MISPEEALDLVVRAASPLEPQSATLAEACGLVLAEEIFAERDCPPFSRSMMDGFAVRLADAGKSVPVAGEIPAGSLWPADLAAGECLEIMTGAPCPSGTEAVVPVEQVSRHDRRVVLPGTIKPGQNIVPLGSECRAGQRAALSRSARDPADRRHDGHVRHGIGPGHPSPDPRNHHHGRRAGGVRATTRAGPNPRFQRSHAGRHGPSTAHPRPAATAGGGSVGPDRAGAGGDGRPKHYSTQRRRFAGNLRPGAPGPGPLRRRDRLSRREAEARQAPAAGAKRPATALRFAGQSPGLPFGVSPLRGGGHWEDERPERSCPALPG